MPYSCSNLNRLHIYCSLFVVNSKLTYFPHQIDYRIFAAYIVFIVYCLWGAAEHRLSGAIVSCCDDDLLRVFCAKYLDLIIFSRKCMHAVDQIAVMNTINHETSLKNDNKIYSLHYALSIRSSLLLRSKVLKLWRLLTWNNLSHNHLLSAMNSLTTNYWTLFENRINTYIYKEASITEMSRSLHPSQLLYQ